MTILSYGGIVSELLTPDRNGNLKDIVLGLPSEEAYRQGNEAYLGALIGRYGNRIADCRFPLQGRVYDGLYKNDGDNHLHGGRVGFDKVDWDLDELSTEEGRAVDLRYRSVDGEEGYPGTLEVKVRYTLTEANQWIIDYEAVTDEPTVFNPTQHSYFNLAGHDAGQPLGHEFRIAASYYTPNRGDGIPTGEVRSVDGTVLDFRSAKALGVDLHSDVEPLLPGRGYDHNLIVDKAPHELGFVAEVFEPDSGRVLNVYSTEPAVQFYAGGFLEGRPVGKGGTVYEKWAGFCLETQHFPNSPNRPQFPSTQLLPGMIFRSRTVYEFGAK